MRHRNGRRKRLQFGQFLTGGAVLVGAAMLVGGLGAGVTRPPTCRTPE
jgi:hypothetical protein